MLVTHPKVPARDVREFIALAKERPDSLNFGSTGTGSGSHLAAELFKFMTRTTPQHISYKGMGPAVIDVMAGQVHFIFGSVLAVVPHMRTGKLHALGVSSERRSAALPNLPTIAEAGVPGYSTVSWSGMQVPSGVPTRSHQARRHSTRDRAWPPARRFLPTVRTRRASTSCHTNNLSRRDRELAQSHKGRRHQDRLNARNFCNLPERYRRHEETFVHA